MTAPARLPAPDIRLVGDPCLRQRCREVAADEDVHDLAGGMLAAMAAHDGVGLAAPQVGDPRRVIVVSDPMAASRRPVVMINPVIDETFGPDVAHEEGCLSFPALFITLRRPCGVAVRYRDRAGQQRTLRDEGFLARVIQHEVDHLDGILFIDHLPRWRRWLLSWRLHRLRQSGRTREVAA
jgi:peptide deformylase